MDNWSNYNGTKNLSNQVFYKTIEHFRNLAYSATFPFSESPCPSCFEKNKFPLFRLISIYLLFPSIPCWVTSSLYYFYCKIFTTLPLPQFCYFWFSWIAPWFAFFLIFETSRHPDYISRLWILFHLSQFFFFHSFRLFQLCLFCFQFNNFSL